jgi:hypothetical protein
MDKYYVSRLGKDRIQISFASKASVKLEKAIVAQRRISTANAGD